MVDLTSQKIEAVLDELDRRGIASFLKKHHFGTPKSYWLTSPSRPGAGPYPAKAVAAVALGWPDINGGYSTYDSACNVLERAGYSIVSANGDLLNDSPAALIRQVERMLATLGATEADALVKRRVGQDVFRAALLERWNSKCAVTGIGDLALLRASHIRSWSDCESDYQRLDVNNGVLLSALWDAAFDRFLISFADDGKVQMSPHLSKDARDLLHIFEAKPIIFSSHHLPYLQWHRARFDANIKRRKAL